MATLNRYSLPTAKQPPTLKAPQSVDDDLLTGLAKQKMASQAPAQPALPAQPGLLPPPKAAPADDSLLAGYKSHLSATGAAPSPSMPGAAPVKAVSALDPNGTMPPAPSSLGSQAPAPAANPAPAAMNFAPPPIHQPPAINPAAPTAPAGGVDEGQLLKQYQAQQAATAAQAAQSQQQTQDVATQHAQNAAQTAAQNRADQVAQQAGSGTPAPAQAAQGPVSLDSLAQLRLDQQKQLEAATTQLAADKARALQNAGASAGLGGLGLSGASATLQGDIRATQDRNAVTTLGQLSQQQHTEQFQQLQRQTALWDTEQAENLDIDKDGNIGPPPDAKGAVSGLVKKAGSNTRLIGAGTLSDGSGLSHANADGSYAAPTPGSASNPYVVSQTDLDNAQQQSGSDFKRSTVGSGAGQTTLYTAPDGTTFVVQSPTGGK